MHFYRQLIFTLLFLLGSFSSSAIEALDTILQLKEVRISAPQKKNPEIIPAQVLSGETLKSLNTHSVADAMRYFSGIQIKDYGGVGGIKTVDIRSMGTNQMGVFYDGIQLGNAQNGQIDLGKFSLDNIEEISLFNGQKSEIFQSAKDFGSAGTIYIRTKRPTFAPGKKFNIKAIFRTGSFDLANPSILWEQKISNSVSSSFNAEFITSSGKYKFRYKKIFQDGSTAWDTTAVRQNGDLQSLRLEGGLNGTFDSGRWNWKAYFYDSNRGIPGAIVNNVWKRSQRQWDRNFFTQGSFQKRFSKFYEMQVSAKYAHDYMHYLNPDTTLMYIDNEFWQQEVYISSANRFTLLPNWEANISVDYQWNKLDATMRDFVNPTRNTILTAFATSYQWWRLKGQASILGSFVFDKAKINNTSNLSTYQESNRSQFTPAVFLSYQPIITEQLFIRAFYKKIFRMPTFNDLYYTDIGNASLKPENATQYNLGVQYTRAFANPFLRLLKVQVDGYYNNISDKIIAVPKGNGQYRWMMMNIGEVRIKGIDLNAQLNLNLPYQIYANIGLTYTYQKAQDYSDPSDNEPGGGTYKGQIAYIPENSGSAFAKLNWRDWDLNYSFIYVGERYHNSSNIPVNLEQPWYTHDVSVGWNFFINKLNCRTSLEVNNLLNQQYDVIQNYPMPGRNFKLILKVEI